MGFLLKALSIISGSSEETLLNAKKEVQFALNQEDISDDTERAFLFEFLGDDIRTLLKDKYKPNYITKEFLKNKGNMAQILSLVINNLIEKEKKGKLVILNRVLYQYYGHASEDGVEHLYLTLERLSIDLIFYCETQSIL